MYSYHAWPTIPFTSFFLIFFSAAEVPPINTISVGDISFLGESLQFTFLLPVSFYLLLYIDNT